MEAPTVPLTDWFAGGVKEAAMLPPMMTAPIEPCCTVMIDALPTTKAATEPEIFPYIDGAFPMFTVPETLGLPVRVVATVPEIEAATAPRIAFPPGRAPKMEAPTKTLDGVAETIEVICVPAWNAMTEPGIMPMFTVPLIEGVPTIVTAPEIEGEPVRVADTVPEIEAATAPNTAFPPRKLSYNTRANRT